MRNEREIREEIKKYEEMLERCLTDTGREWNQSLISVLNWVLEG